MVEESGVDSSWALPYPAARSKNKCYWFVLVCSTGTVFKGPVGNSAMWGRSV